MEERRLQSLEAHQNYLKEKEQVDAIIQKSIEAEIR